MPDAKEMSGIPRPVNDLPNATISVRLIRGELSNNIAGHPVELHVGSNVMTVKTDENGRAQFDKLTPGARVKAVAVVDGEQLESQEFPVPAQGGVRLMLVATDKSKGPATTPNAPAIQGEVVIGGESRIVIEPGDERVRVFYLLDIENTARVPVNPASPIAFDVPGGATGTTILEGSTPKATVKGSRVTVQSPLPPGHTFVQVGYDLAGGTGSIEISQAFPANMQQLAVVVRKVGDTTFRSPQIAQQREMPAQGETYIAATGGAVKAGQAIELSVSGYPHHSAAPRTIALTLAAVIAAIGAWTAGRQKEDEALEATERKRLVARREKLFGDLVRLESERRSGKIDDKRYATRREDLLAALEHLYNELDVSVPPGQPAPLANPVHAS